MHLAFTVTAILLAFIYPVRAHGYTRDHQNDSSTTCQRPSTVEAFAASFYTALVVTKSPDVVFGIELAGQKAAECLYPTISRALATEGVRKGDKIAWKVSRAFALDDTIKLNDYIERTAFGVGKFLLEEGLLHCKNAISLALDYFKFVKRELKGLDAGKFESYMEGIVLGMAHFFHKHGLELEVFVPAFHWRLVSEPAFFRVDSIF